MLHGYETYTPNVQAMFCEIKEKSKFYRSIVVVDVLQKKVKNNKVAHDSDNCNKSLLMTHICRHTCLLLEETVQGDCDDDNLQCYHVVLNPTTDARWGGQGVDHVVGTRHVVGAVHVGAKSFFSFLSSTATYQGEYPS
jgi:hypothetical protein